MNRDQKAAAVAEIADQIKESQAVFAVDYRGITVAQVADAMDHHPDVSREPDSLVFRLWTHSEDGVTTKDVDLAARVDQVLSGSATDTGTTA